jgi:hypothetical protein
VAVTLPKQPAIIFNGNFITDAGLFGCNGNVMAAAFRRNVPLLARVQCSTAGSIRSRSWAQEIRIWLRYTKMIFPSG